jgi:hypothetical protein
MKSGANIYFFFDGAERRIILDDAAVAAICHPITRPPLSTATPLGSHSEFFRLSNLRCT